MQIRSLLFTAVLAAHVSAIVVHYMCFYAGGPDAYVARSGSIPDHKAQSLVDGMNRWSRGQFEAVRVPTMPGSIVVKNIRLTSDVIMARRMLGSMVTLVSGWVLDG